MGRYLLSSIVVCFLRFSLLLSIKTVVQSLELNDQKAIGGLAGSKKIDGTLFYIVLLKINDMSPRTGRNI